MLDFYQDLPHETDSKDEDALYDEFPSQKEATSHEATFDEGTQSNNEGASHEEVAPTSHKITNMVAHSTLYLASLLRKRRRSRFNSQQYCLLIET